MSTLVTVSINHAASTLSGRKILGQLKKPVESPLAKWTASGILSMPSGRVILGGIAIGIILAGIFQWIKAIKGSYRSNFTLDSYAAGKRRWIERVAKLGLIARGVVLPNIGVFLLMAALQSDASEVKGIGEALGELRRQSYGTILLSLTAIGLICYAIYCVVLAIYGNFGRKG